MWRRCLILAVGMLLVAGVWGSVWAQAEEESSALDGAPREGEPKEEGQRDPSPEEAYRESSAEGGDRDQPSVEGRRESSTEGGDRDHSPEEGFGDSSPAEGQRDPSPEEGLNTSSPEEGSGTEALASMGSTSTQPTTWGQIKSLFE